MSKLTTIVLAGGKAKPEFFDATGVTNRAMVPLAPGKTMLRFVLCALRSTDTVGEIIVVGDVPLSEADGIECCRVIEPGSSLIDNILLGFKTGDVDPNDYALLVSSDIPFIKAYEIDSFARASLALHCDFCYPIIPMADYKLQFAALKRTTLKLREGEFTGGNIMLVRAGVLSQNVDSTQAAYAARKSVFALGRMLGWGLLGRILLSQLAVPNILTIPVLESAVSKLMGKGVTARAVVSPDASLGTDIDDPSDIEFAKKFLA